MFYCAHIATMLVRRTKTFSFKTLREVGDDTGFKIAVIGALCSPVCMSVALHAVTPGHPSSTVRSSSQGTTNCMLSCCAAGDIGQTINTTGTTCMPRLVVSLAIV
jgi:hypothetical protein